MVGTSHRIKIDEARSILPPWSIYGMRGSKKVSCDGLADNNKDLV